jgi:hypothetical protein
LSSFISSNIWVVDHQGALVGHEDLEGIDAVFVDHARYFLARMLVEIGDRAVERVIAHRMAVGLLMPGLDGGLETVALGLDGEVHDGRGAAVKPRQRAGFKGVAGKGAHEGQFHVGMGVDTPGEQVAARRVDHPVRGLVQPRSDHGNLFTLDVDVPIEVVRGRHHGTVSDQQRTHVTRSCL